LKGFLNNFIFI